MNVEKNLLQLKDALFKTNNWQKIILSREWANKVPAEAGVYVLKENKEIVYVGETGNLRGRMKDLLDSRHHCVRRTIGKKLFVKQKGFRPADTKNKFPNHIEVLVNNHICKNLSLAFLPVSFGRKELEEYIEKDLKDGSRLNRRGKRKSA